MKSMKRLFTSIDVRHGWVWFALGSALLLLGAAAFEYSNTVRSADGTPLWHAVVFGGRVGLASLLAGLAMLCGRLVVKGRTELEHGRETVLWTAYLVGTLITGLRMMNT